MKGGMKMKAVANRWKSQKHKKRKSCSYKRSRRSASTGAIRSRKRRAPSNIAALSAPEYVDKKLGKAKKHKGSSPAEISAKLQETQQDLQAASAQENFSLDEYLKALGETLERCKEWQKSAKRCDGWIRAKDFATADEAVKVAEASKEFVNKQYQENAARPEIAAVADLFKSMYTPLKAQIISEYDALIKLYTDCMQKFACSLQKAIFKAEKELDSTVGNMTSPDAINKANNLRNQYNADKSELQKMKGMLLAHVGVEGAKIDEITCDGLKRLMDAHRKTVSAEEKVVDVTTVALVTGSKHDQNKVAKAEADLLKKESKEVHAHEKAGVWGCPNNFTVDTALAELDATLANARSKYKKAQLKYHPDRCDDDKMGVNCGDKSGCASRAIQFLEDGGHVLGHAPAGESGVGMAQPDKEAAKMLKVVKKLQSRQRAKAAKNAPAQITSREYVEEQEQEAKAAEKRAKAGEKAVKQLQKKFREAEKKKRKADKVVVHQEQKLAKAEEKEAAAAAKLEAVDVEGMGTMQLPVPAADQEHAKQISKLEKAKAKAEKERQQLAEAQEAKARADAWASQNASESSAEAAAGLTSEDADTISKNAKKNRRRRAVRSAARSLKQDRKAEELRQMEEAG